MAENETKKLSPDTAEMDPDRGADSPKVRLLTLDDLDRRTRAGQRAFELHDRLVSERGGKESMGTLRYAMTSSVAVLSAMIEDLQTRWLMGEPVEPSAIATLLNARRREAEIIGIDPEPRDVTLDLRDHMKKYVEPEDGEP